MPSIVYHHLWQRPISAALFAGDGSPQHRKTRSSLRLREFAIPRDGVVHWGGTFRSYSHEGTLLALARSQCGVTGS